MDGAPCHRAGELKVPENIRIVEQPPYSPELNPAEHIWEEMREKWFQNRTFDSMKEVITTMVQSLRCLEEDQSLLRSLTGFHWIKEAVAPN